ncbi:MAG TPA: hypothetical protein VJN96_09140 [Vicinamibacterales bacterium]|nr:hypothetical protein [Vicinamibacterales bacterium]
MDLGQVVEVIKAIGSLIVAIEGLVSTLHASGVSIPPSIHEQLAAARQAHQALRETSTAV